MVDSPHDQSHLGAPPIATPAGASRGGARRFARDRRARCCCLSAPASRFSRPTPRGAALAASAVSRELGGSVVDFQHFHIERLRSELARIAVEQRTLIAASRGTLASQSRVHKAVLAVLAAGSFEQLLQTVTTDLAVLLDVDIVTIGVESATPGGRLSVQGIRLLKAGAIDELLGPERTILLRADMPGESALFGGAAGLVRSHALLRLGFGRGAPLGLLCIGTRKAGRFHPGLGTELLTFLARVVAITIAQWLQPRGCPRPPSATQAFPNDLPRHPCRWRGLPQPTICAPRSGCGWHGSAASGAPRPTRSPPMAATSPAFSIS